MATLGLSKVFILDKYFTELQKFWETEKKLQDASSSNEAVHLQQRLKSLSTELVTLRNRLHVDQDADQSQDPVISKAQHKGSTGQTIDLKLTQGSNNTASLDNATKHNNAVIHNHHRLPSAHGSSTGQQQCQLNALPSNLTNSNIALNSLNSGHHHGTANKNVFHGSFSTRNTSIPHPLPHQINDDFEKLIVHQSSTIPPGSIKYTTNTLPARYHNYVNHTLTSQLSSQVQKYPNSNRCGSNTLPGGYSNASVANGQLAYYGLKASYPEDLIHLAGPLTEDAVMRTLQARFSDNKFFTNVGPILLSINPYLDVGNPLTLSSTRSLALAPQLCKIVHEAVRQQADTGYPQAIILSGTSGAGKTHCSMLLLRQLFAVAGGGPETDAFKHLAAAFTVLRSLGSAKTAANSESSRIGQFIEVQVTDGALYRTKIHCYFLDQTRVIRPLPKEKNYHIFYQMLAGLSKDERIKLNLDGYSSANLRYLKSGDTNSNNHEDAQRFQAWKTCLGILGIPFLDVVRVLAAVLLLGNVEFVDGQGLEVEVKGETELNAVSSLLGVPPAALFRGLTTRTHAPNNARNQLVKAVCDANKSNMTRDCLAKALYCRTVATIVRRANSLKRLGSTLGTLSSDSNESVHNQGDGASQHASTVGGTSNSKSMAVLNNAVRHATDGFIGILDMFGFEEPSPHAQLEHLCINLCAETMQHFYNTHIFKSSVESCRDEGIGFDTEVDYVDNVPCIDLISSLRTGLLSMLDAECSVRGTAESYVAKIKVQHRNSQRLEIKSLDPRVFLIRHFAGRIVYDASAFLATNRDVVPDDLVAVFYKHSCNFGFATHLFGSELKALYALDNVPCGLSFRISPTSHTDLLNGNEPVSTLTQDFHTRLDNLLRTLVHARPHFVRCIRSNVSEKGGYFERVTVMKQIRTLQVLETVNLMASGFPHRMRFKQFNIRYRILTPLWLVRRIDDKAIEELTQLILQNALENLNTPLLDSSVNLNWAIGKRHVFLSEGIRQHLEHLLVEIRNKSATLIQATWRGWHLRKKMLNVKMSERTMACGGGVGGGGGGVGGVVGLPTTASQPISQPTSQQHIIPPLPSTRPSSSHNKTPNQIREGGGAMLATCGGVGAVGGAVSGAVGGAAVGAGGGAVVGAAAGVVSVAANAVPGTSGAAVSAEPRNNGNQNTFTRPRPQPIAGTPPPELNDKCDSKILQEACNFYGINLERPPPVPPSRSYVIVNQSKVHYPHARVMKMNFPEDSICNPATAADQLKKGETIMVTGPSTRRGHLLVELNAQTTFHVPFQYFELPNVSVAASGNGSYADSANTASASNIIANSNPSSSTNAIINNATTTAAPSIINNNNTIKNILCSNAGVAAAIVDRGRQEAFHGAATGGSNNNQASLTASAVNI